MNIFSLLGKSNEEAFLILREVWQVESRPGYFELTMSLKIKNGLCGLRGLIGMRRIGEVCRRNESS